MAKVTLVTGGTRSGKSYLALQKALVYSGERLFFATATLCDKEMEERIAKHQEERGNSFTTIETPYILAETLREKGTSEVAVILIDCLTIWIGNLMYKHGDNASLINSAIDDLCTTVTEIPVDCIIVTNEVGMGIVPENKMAREFRDLAGLVNRRIAAAAEEVFLSVCGISLKIK